MPQTARVQLSRSVARRGFARRFSGAFPDPEDLATGVKAPLRGALEDGVG